MRLNKNLLFLITVMVLVSSPVGAEIKTFIGIDAVKIETTLTYLNGQEKYDLEGVRLRYGIENSRGGSAGIELISGDSDEKLDPFGDLFKLETGETFGLYATLGKPVYLRVGWSIWQTEYSNVALNVVDRETVNSLEIGLGFNLLVGRNLTLYADWSVRDTDASYPTYIIGLGEDPDYHSELLSAGINLKF
jgi:hypothetical protein